MCLTTYNFSQVRKNIQLNFSEVSLTYICFLFKTKHYVFKIFYILDIFYELDG